MQIISNRIEAVDLTNLTTWFARIWNWVSVVTLTRLKLRDTEALEFYKQILMNQSGISVETKNVVIKDHVFMRGQ